jgi:hypothetical protein
MTPRPPSHRAAIALLAMLGTAILASCAGAPAGRSDPFKGVPTPKGNLLQNPGFEDDPVRILPWHIIVHADPKSYQHSLVAEAAREGERGIRLERVADEPWGGLFQQVTYNNGKPATLRFRGWVKGEGLEEAAVMQIRYGMQFRSDRASTIFIPPAQLNQGWTPIQVELRLPAGPTGIEVTLLQYGAGNLMADDLSLEVVGP